MKAKFFFLGLCALALAACSIDEVSQMNDSNAIQFKATTATRAASTTTNNLESFSVWAWNTVDGATLTTPFMDDVVAKKSGSVFTTSPLYFWPTGTVDFYALTPSTTLTAVEDDQEYAYIGGSLDAGEDYWSYTGNVAKAKIAQGAITVEVENPGSYAEQIDLCYAVTKEQSASSVAMNFRHAFSQVVFKALNTNEEMTINIAGVKVCSVNRHGTYALPTVSTTTNLATSEVGTSGISDSQGSWTVSDGSNGTTATPSAFEAGMSETPVTLAGKVSEAVTLTSADGALLMIPQTVDAWDPDEDKTDANLGSYIRILCNITEDGATLWPNSVESDNAGQTNSTYQQIGDLYYAEIAVPVDVTWEEGWRYTYTLVFGEGAGYYAPDDPNSDVEGTPVFVPITFTVTVDEFQDTENKYVSTNPDAVTDLSSLKAAIEAGASEITVDAPIELEQGDVLYFTNDCHLTLNADLTYAPVSDYTGGNDGTTSLSIIVVGSDATLTIDAADDVNIACDGSNGNNGDDWVSCISVGTYFTDETNNDPGHLIINGGNYKGGVWNDTSANYTSVPTIYIFCGDVEINGGNFVGGWSKWSGSGYTYSDTGWAANTLNCLDAPRKANTDENTYAWFFVKGGSFREFNPANNASEGNNTNYVVDGYTSTSSTGTDGFTWFTVAKD